MIRYGILGFGHHGVARLVPGFAGAKESTLAGIWRRDLEKAHANANEFGIEHVFYSAEDLCASPAIDAIVVASPDALHSQDTLLALTHGKPVLCEKPMAMDAQEAKTMVAAASNAGLPLGVAQNFRYNRSVHLVRSWIEDGRVGKPVFATAQFYFDSGRSKRKWIYDPSLACGGAIGDVGIHCLDVLRFVLDDDPMSIATLARSDAQSGSLEATAVLAVEFAHGTLGSVVASFRSPYRTLIEVVGESGTIQCENGLTVDRPVEVLLREKGEIVDRQEVSNTDAYSRMLDAFSRSIAGQESYAATGEDGLKNQVALDAAYRSWRSGQRETIVY